LNDIASSLNLRKSAELQALLNAIDRAQGVVKLDLDGVVLSANDNFLSWVGFTAEELQGQPHTKLCHPEYAASADYRDFWQTLRRGEFHTGEFARVAKDGSTVWIRASYNPVFDEEGRVSSVVKFATNVTADKMRAADFEGKMRALDLSQAVIEFDTTGRVLHANDNFLRIFNYSVEQVIGRHHLMFCEEAYVRTPGYAEFWRNLAQGRFKSGQFKRLDSLGREVWLQATYNPVLDADGRLTKIVKFASDVTDWKRRNADFEGIVAAIKRSVAVIEFDLKGRVLDVSPMMAEILDYSPEELIGEHHTRLLDPDHFDQESYMAFWAALRRGEPQRDDFARRSKTGRLVHLQASYNPVSDADGRIYKVIKFAIDLTERHALNEALREAVRKAEAATESKSMFLANMSHEIRTPMNSVIGFTDLLAQERLDEKQHHYVDTIATSARSLLHLLNDILDASKLEHGSMSIEQIDFSLAAVCEHCIDTMGVLANRKGISLELRYQPDLPLYYTGDPERLRQILVNLMGNAIKFTERGGVTLVVSGEASGQVQIAVHDTGIGIPADRIEKIFEPFSQADGSITRRYGGTGLGTTIVRQLVTLMGGRIDVQSVVGEGSVFSVTLPLKPGSKPAEPVSSDVDDIRPLRILVVDDAPQNIDLLVNVLAKHKHEVTTAVNGRMAVDLYCQQPFDLLLLDMHMPVMNGFEAAREIRRIENQNRSNRVPMIALTASVEAERRHLAIEAGMDSFVMKPLDVAILRAEIARVTSGKLTPVVNPTKACSGTPGPPASEHIDWLSGINRWGGEEVLSRAIRTFVAESRPSLETMLSEPMPDVDRVKQIMHRFKGAAANLSLMRIAAAAKRAESRAASCTAEEYLATLAHLAEEIDMVSSMLVARETAISDKPGLMRELGSDAMAELIERVADSFRSFEIDENLLLELCDACPRAEFEAVQQAVDSFDFEGALKALDSLKLALTA